MTRTDTYEDFKAWRDTRSTEQPTVGDAAREFTGTTLKMICEWFTRYSAARSTGAPAPVRFITRIDWSRDDGMFAAVLLRDGQPWFLDGALVGMGSTRAYAVADLEGIARHLVIYGENYLHQTLPLADREWLSSVLEPGDTGMHTALAWARQAQKGGTT